MHEWMAIYDLSNTAELDGEAYLALRGAPVQSQRERDIRPQVDIDRRTYDFMREWKVENFKKLEDVDAEGSGNVVVSVFFTLKDEKDSKELTAWYDDEHVDMLSKVPGWLRSRRFITSPLDNRDEVEYVAIHDYAPNNGLGGPEFKAATSTPWRNRIMSEVVKAHRRRVYSLNYTFGGGPRDLTAPLDWDSPATMTRTFSTATHKSSGAIESYITTSDGVRLPYRLEGSSDPHAPLILLSNSILVTYGIWDSFVTSFLSKPENSKYRILRYNTRGRNSDVGTKPVTVDVLGDDIIALLDALRVQKAAAIAGVSLGGATVLSAALRYPDRIGAFVSCDTNAKSPAGNSKAWGDRIAMAEKEGASITATDGKEEAIVGEELAEITTRRWFVPETYDGADMEQEALRIKEMVRTNSLNGFKGAVKALWEYDMEESMRGNKVKGLFLVGDQDGVLPKTMAKMAEDCGGDVGLFVVPGAGHLPMVEKPEKVVEAIEKVLR